MANRKEIKGIMIPHNSSDYWTAIVVEPAVRTTSYYIPLPMYDIGNCCESVEGQMKRVREKFSQDYLGCKSPLKA